MSGGEDNFGNDFDIDLFDESIEFDIDDEGDGSPDPEPGKEGEIPKKPVISGGEFLEIDENGDASGDEGDPDEDPEEDEGDPTDNKNEKKKPTTPSKTKTGDASSPPSQLYAAFAKQLVEDGVLSDFEDEDFETLVEESGSPGKALLELARKSVAEAVEEYKSTAEAEYKAFLEARDSGIDPNGYTDTNKLITYLEGLDDETLTEDAEKSEFVIRSLLESKGMKPAKIDKLIKQYEALGTMDEEAIEARDELLELKKEELETEKENAKRLKVQREAETAKQREELKKSVYETSEIIPGIKLSNKEKDAIYQTITTPVGTYPNGQPYNAVMALRMKNPLAFEKTLHYLLHMGVFNLDNKNNPKPDWSKIVKVKQTQTANEFDKLLQGADSLKASGKPAKTGGSREITDLGLSL